MMKKLGYILVLLSSLVLCLGVASAAAPGGAEVTTTSDLGEYVTPYESVDVEAGNITFAELQSDMSTARWAGLIGNATGNIVLGDDRNETMYNWGGDAIAVYASTGAPDWNSLAISDCATLNLAWLNDQAVDNCTNTFDAQIDMDSNLFEGLGATAQAQSQDDGGADNWYTYLYTDGAEDVFAGEVNLAGTAYNGDTVDFQMLLPEDGTNQDTAVETYNLWVELQ
mgnify:CR=1 FL=1